MVVASLPTFRLISSVILVTVPDANSVMASRLPVGCLPREDATFQAHGNTTFQVQENHYGWERVLPWKIASNTYEQLDSKPCTQFENEDAATED
jgi:hypothetical protein